VHGRGLQIDDRVQSSLVRERDRLFCRDFEHAPASRHNAVAKRHDQAAVRGQHRRDDRHRGSPLQLIEMYPNAADHDQVERFAAHQDGIQAGKTVIDPFDQG